MMHTGEKPVDPLLLIVEPGANGSARIYDDAGDSLGYKKNEFTWTEVRQLRSANTVKIEILPITGSYPGMPAQRSYQVALAEAWPPESVTVNGMKAEWTFNGDWTSVLITTPRFPVTQKVEIVVTTAPALARQEMLLSGIRGRIARYKHALALSEKTWPNGWAPDALLSAAQAGDRMSLFPQSALQEIQKLHQAVPEIMQQLHELRTSLDKGPAKSADLSGVGVTMQKQKQAVERALAHIAQ